MKHTPILLLAVLFFHGLSTQSVLAAESTSFVGEDTVESSAETSFVSDSFATLGASVTWRSTAMESESFRTTEGASTSSTSGNSSAATTSSPQSSGTSSTNGAGSGTRGTTQRKAAAAMPAKTIVRSTPAVPPKPPAAKSLGAPATAKSTTVPTAQRSNSTTPLPSVAPSWIGNSTDFIKRVNRALDTTPKAKVIPLGVKKSAAPTKTKVRPRRLSALTGSTIAVHAAIDAASVPMMLSAMVMIIALKRKRSDSKRHRRR